MAAWMIPAALMALGIAKGEQDKRREKKQQLLNSEITRYSPWTDIANQPVQFADPSGSAMQGLMGGLMMQQGMDSADKQNALLDAQTQYYQNAQMQSGYVPGQGMPPYAQSASPYMGIRSY